MSTMGEGASLGREAPRVNATGQRFAPHGPEELGRSSPLMGQRGMGGPDGYSHCSVNVHPPCV